MDTGLVFAGSASNVAGSDPDWVNPGNVTADDGSNASVTITTTNSDSLLTGSYGFSIPAWADIKGVEVELDVGSVTDNGYLVIFTKDSINNVGASKTWFASGIKILGGPTDLWSTTYTPAEVNASTFGLWVRAFTLGTVGGTMTIDYVKVRITYEVGKVESMATLKYSRPFLRRRSGV
jgi:hypothetical protein